MIFPDFRRFTPGRKLLMVRKVAVKLASTDALHPSSSLVSSSGPGMVKLPPASATRISICPSLS